MDERVVVTLRAHSSRLLGPTLVLLIGAPLTGALLGRVQGPARWAALAVAVVVAARGALWPFLRWYTTRYELTTRRVRATWGILSRHGHDVPWWHVVDSGLDRSLRQRLTGCGTVVLVTHGRADDGPAEVLLSDVPQPHRVWRTTARLVAESGGGRNR